MIDPKTFSYTATGDGDATMVVRIYGTPAGQTLMGTYTRAFKVQGPDPALANGGIVIGCAPNEEVAIDISVTPFDATSCFFHCSQLTTAPSGYVLKHHDPIEPTVTGNPLLAVDAIVFPSGLTNGYQAFLKVDNIYDGCDNRSITVSSYTPIWYGPPIISSSNQFLFEPGSNMWHCSVAQNPGGVGYATWSLVSGDASFSSSNDLINISVVLMEELYKWC